ncbi:hypothetical protein GQ457_04G007370 [Hibiscus cannabinus]
MKAKLPTHHLRSATLFQTFISFPGNQKEITKHHLYPMGQKLADPGPEVKEDEVLIKAVAGALNPVDCQEKEGQFYAQLLNFLSSKLWNFLFRRGLNSLVPLLLALKTKNLDFAQAVSLPLAIETAHEGLERTGFSADESTLVLDGAGSVGSLVFRFMVNSGSNVKDEHKPRKCGKAVKAMKEDGSVVALTGTVTPPGFRFVVTSKGEVLKKLNPYLESGIPRGHSHLLKLSRLSHTSKLNSLFLALFSEI